MMRVDFPAIVMLRRIRQQIRRARARTIMEESAGPLLRPAFSQQYPGDSRQVRRPESRGKGGRPHRLAERRAVPQVEEEGVWPGPAEGNVAGKKGKRPVRLVEPG